MENLILALHERKKVSFVTEKVAYKLINKLVKEPTNLNYRLENQNHIAFLRVDGKASHIIVSLTL